jgi:predicted nucleotidyltransferase
MNAFSLDIEKITEICRENDVAMLGVFGSVARGEATEKSDIDLLVRFSERKGLLALVRFERILSETLGRQVDLLTEAAISPYIRENILNDLQVLYGSR